MIPIARIQQMTAEEFGVDPAIMTAPFSRGEGRNGRNTTSLSRTRQVAMYLAFELTNHSKANIGRLFGGRDHTTVMHAIAIVGKRMLSEEGFPERVEGLRQKLLAESPIPLLIVRPEPQVRKQPPPKSDWRVKEREERREDIRAAALMRHMSTGPKVRDEDRVYRDPCIKCGTRGDIGCVHTRVAA
jgi:hypothetical protein